jgi:hypothetical protein
MLRAAAAGQHLGAFVAADVDVGQDLFQLLVRSLRADHGRGIERAALRIACTRAMARSMNFS